MYIVQCIASSGLLLALNGAGLSSLVILGPGLLGASAQFGLGCCWLVVLSWIGGKVGESVGLRR